MKNKTKIIEDYINSLSSEEHEEMSRIAGYGPDFFSFEDWRVRWGYTYDEALKEVEDKIEMLKGDIEDYLKLDDEENGKWELIARAAGPLEEWIQHKKQALNGTGFIMFKHLFEE